MSRRPLRGLNLNISFKKVVKIELCHSRFSAAGGPFDCAQSVLSASAATWFEEGDWRE
jgi:hypothetical protein